MFPGVPSKQPHATRCARCAPQVQLAISAAGDVFVAFQVSSAPVPATGPSVPPSPWL